MVLLDLKSTFQTIFAFQAYHASNLERIIACIKEDIEKSNQIQKN